ncbi:MAG: hypothetical protein ACMXYF_00455 [Candidatus Woesearchaeota archaeon]
MNHGYKKNPPKPFVYWHFRPRYREKIEFSGKQFQDLEFAHHYDRERKKFVSKDILEKISQEMKSFL